MLLPYIANGSDVLLAERHVECWYLQSIQNQVATNGGSFKTFTSE